MPTVFVLIDEFELPCPTDLSLPILIFVVLNFTDVAFKVKP